MLRVVCEVRDADYLDEGVRELLSECVQAVFGGEVLVVDVEGLAPVGDSQMTIWDTGRR